MIKKLFAFTALLILVASFSDCSLKKRTYRDGYYVSWNKKVKKPSSHIVSKATKTEEKIDENKEFLKEDRLIGSIDNSNVPVDNTSNKPIMLSSDTCGDLIIMRNGEQIVAKVIELSEEKIKYRPCNNLTGPLIVANIDRVNMIKYVNGAKDVFEIKPKRNEISQINEQRPAVRKNNDLAVASFISGFFFWLFFIPGIAAIIMGAIALVQFKNNPDKYKNEWMAKFWIIFFLSIIAIALIAFVLTM